MVISSKAFSLKLFFALLAIPVVWSLASWLGWLTYLEYESLDWRFRARGEIEAPVKLIYVDLDSEAIELMGERPIPRVFFAETVDALFQFGKVKVVGIDAVFSDSAHSILVDPYKVKLDNEAFKKVIDREPALVLAATYTSQFDPLGKGEYSLKEFPFIYKGYVNPNLNSLPEQPGPTLIGADKGNLGLINVNDQYSPGNMPRWVPMFALTPGPTYLTLSLEMARIFYGVDKKDVVIEDDYIYLNDPRGNPLMTIPLTDNQMVEVNWFTPWASDKNIHYSMKTVLGAAAWMKQGNPEQKKAAEEFFKAFNEALILIGPVDPLLHDLAPSPFELEPVPKVGVHGNLLKTMFADAFLVRFPFWVNIVILFALTMIMTSLGIWSGAHSGVCKMASLLVLILYIVAVFYLFDMFHWVLPFVTPVGAAVSTTFVGVVFQLIVAEKQKSRIKGLFGTYVSPELVSKMVESGEEPQLGGVEEKITAFFSDVENFSTFSEILSPSQLVDLMNDYLTAMTDALQEEGGTLDKYIGDAIVAMFGAPLYMKDHALAACRVACRVQEIQKELCAKWERDKGKNWPNLVHYMRTRVGLNTGLATVGNMGSSTRFNYTMMGDTVNLAARCESGAKSYGVYGMVTEDTKVLAEENDKSVFFRFLDYIVVKGRSKPVRMYELVGFKDNLSGRVIECAEIYEEAMQHYLHQNWDKAIQLFEKASKIERFQPGRDGVLVNPSLVFMKRCDIMRTQPPDPNWNGVFAMKVK